MTSTPEISVVMGVRNVAGSLPETLDSLLTQADVTLELVVVDDGSTDDTWQVLLGSSKRDARVRPLRQGAQGLTVALAAGCDAARGAVLVRQDAGPWNRSLPGRLRATRDLFRARPDVALASCGVRWFGPEGELIEEVHLTECEAAEGLTRLDLTKVRGVTHHGATAFPADLYRRVGGYRPVFRFAQDLDLWLRLVEHGPHVALAGTYVEVAYRASSTTFLHRGVQVRLAKLAIEAARQRRRGGAEGPVLAAAAELSREAPGAASRGARAAGHYYLASRLRRGHPGSARRHYREAIALAPWHVKAWLRWLTTRS